MKAKRFIQNVGGRCLAIGVMALLGTGWAQAAPAPQPMGGGDTSLAIQLFTESGLAAEKKSLMKAELPADSFTNPFNLLFVGMPPSQVELVNQIYTSTFDVEEFYNDVQQRLIRDLDPRKATEVLNFLSGDVGQHMVGLEAQFNNDYLKILRRGQALLASYRAKGSQEELSSGTRMALIARMTRAMGLVQHDIQIMRSILKVVEPLNKYFQTAEDAETMHKQLEGNLPEYMKTIRVVMLFRIYEGLTMRELEEAVKFYESEEGRWFSKTRNAAYMDGQETMNNKARSRIHQALKALEEGQQDSAIFKELFPPGLRYLFTRKRDPFYALIDPKRELLEKMEKKEAVVGGKRFGAELETLPSLPLEGFKILSQVDPQLYDDIEFRAQLFREKQELQDYSNEDYQAKVQEYREMLLKALDLLKQEILTPLQVDYSSLKLVGTVVASSQRFALVEDMESKGYTVRPGMLVGPNFGVVESIDETGIQVVERQRNFQGEIQTETMLIQYAGQGE